MEIDLVYLWVDGSDPVWRAKKNAWLNGSGSIPKQNSVIPHFVVDNQQEQAVGDCRFSDNDELKYSLRSVEMFAPWIRRIFIVTDGQTPEWLDTSNPRIRVVHQESLLAHAPENQLPTFNSNTIELNLWRIPELSECFLYANDDMFFAGSVNPSFFFDDAGHPVVRLKQQSIHKHLDRIYPYTIYSSQQEIRQRFGKYYRLAPHHNVDAYNKTGFCKCVKELSERVAATTAHRFRDKEDLQRAVLLYYALAKDEARQVRISYFNGTDTLLKVLKVLLGWAYYVDSRTIPLTTPIDKMRRILKKYHPKLVCLNDGEQVSAESRMQVGMLLNEFFPDKSQFER